MVSIAKKVKWTLCHYTRQYGFDTFLRGMITDIND